MFVNNKNWNENLVATHIDLETAEDDLWGNQYIEAYSDNFSDAPTDEKYRVSQLRITDHSPEIVVKFGHPQLRYDAHFLKTMEGEFGKERIIGFHGPCYNFFLWPWLMLNASYFPSTLKLMKPSLVGRRRAASWAVAPLKSSLVHEWRLL